MQLQSVSCTRMLLFLAGALTLHAFDSAPSAPSPINTDRPAVTDASTVVPAGSLQLENGFLETVTPGQSSFDFSETNIRLGLLEKTEIRFTVPDYFVNFNAGNGYASGWGDSIIGVKQQLGPVSGFDVSIVASMSMPTGARNLSSHGYDPQFQLPWSRSLSANWTVAGMFSFFYPTQGSKRIATEQAAFLLDRQLTKRWDAFLEYVGTFEHGSSPQHLLHTGTAYKLAADQQVDFHAGFGLSPAAVDHFLGIGYSIRFQMINKH